MSLEMYNKPDKLLPDKLFIISKNRVVVLFQCQVYVRWTEYDL